MRITTVNSLILDSIDACNDDVIVDVIIDNVKLTGVVTSTNMRHVTIDVRGISITTLATNIVRFH
jgi:hypothetical protein